MTPSAFRTKLSALLERARADRDNGERQNDLAYFLEGSAEAVLLATGVLESLRESKAMNAWAHEQVRQALAALNAAAEQSGER
jgi:hypothetical protein